MLALTASLLPLALGGVLLRRGLLPARPLLGRERGGGGRGARWARRDDLRALLLDRRAAHPGRLGLGTVHGLLRPALVAAEQAQSVVVVGTDAEREDHRTGACRRSSPGKARWWRPA